MSSRNGQSVPAAASVTSSNSHQRHSSTNSTLSKPPKSTSPGGQQQKQNLGVSTSTGGISSSTSSSSFFPASKQQQNHGDPTTLVSSTSAKDATKVFRRESTKVKPHGDRKSIFGWLRHHIVDTNDSPKTSGSAGGSSKKKPETAESYARMNNLSDSMPSLMVQLNASVPTSSKPPVNMSSSGAAMRKDASAASNAMMMSSSPAVPDDVINYRIRKKTSGPDEEAYGGGSASVRVKASRSMRTLSGRNRWSSYDITAGVPNGLPQVVIEDSDESAAGDEDSNQTSMRLTSGQHHLLSEAVSSSGRAHSVEALFIGGSSNEHLLEPSSRLVTSDSKSLLSNQVSECDSGVTVSLPASPSVHIDDHHLLIEKLRQMDERIEKARGDRNQLLDQLLHISDKEGVSPNCNVDSATSRSRDLLFGTLNEVDRLTSHIVELLRPSSSMSAPNDVFVPYDAKNGVADAFVPDQSSMQLFQEIGGHLRHQLTLLKKTMAAPYQFSEDPTTFPTERVTFDCDVAPSGESLSNDLEANRILDVEDIVILPPSFQEQSFGETAS